MDSQRTVYIDANYPELGNISITNIEGEVFIKMYESGTQMTDASTRFQLDVYNDLKKIKEMTIEGRDKLLSECKKLVANSPLPFKYPIT